MYRRPIFPVRYIWNLWPRFVYSLCHLSGSTKNVKRSIRQNSAPPCVKGRTTLCACAKSLNLWFGVQNNYIFGIPDTTLPIHQATFMLLRWSLACEIFTISWFLAEKSMSHFGAKFGIWRRQKGLDVNFSFYNPKRHTLGWCRVISVIIWGVWPPEKKGIYK